jgi:RNA polymerase sigma-70 factor (ECF subfamily)
MSPDAAMPLDPNPSSADLALMQSVAMGDPKAQTEVVQRLAGRLRRLASLICRPGTDSDDAAQLSLIEVLHSARTFQTATSLERWADRITIRVVARMARREKLHRRLFARWLTPGMLPWGTSLSTEAREAYGLDRVLSVLSYERRIAFVLKHAVGCSVEEIAELTGAPEGTVKDRLVAARRQLRRHVLRDAKRSGS